MENVNVIIFANGSVSLSTKKIGYNGENKARNIIISLDKPVEDGTAVLEIEQHNKKYFLELDKQENNYVLPIYESLLAYDDIKMQFRLVKDGNVIIKSEVFEFEIENSINAIIKGIPEEYGDWFIDTTNAIKELKEKDQDLENKISTLEGEIPDVSNFVTKDVENLTNYTKTSELEKNYASKNDIKDFIKKDVAELDNFTNNTDLENKLNDKADKSEIPKNTGDLTNNSGFITKDVTDLEHYYDKDAIDGKVSSVYKFKGSVDTYSDLSSKEFGVVKGDVYNVTDTDKNYAWDGSAWDDLGGTIDLSDYVTNEKLNEQVKGVTDKIDTLINDVADKVDAEYVNDTIATAISGALESEY